MPSTRTLEKAKVKRRRSSALAQIASALGRRDEVPNRELALRLAKARDHAGVREIAAGLRSKESGVAQDCIKVLYEIGYVAPELVAPYDAEFCDLLQSRNNRMVWGAMTAIRTIASVRAEQLFRRRAEILKAMREGSVITVDTAVAAVALIAAKRSTFRRELVPVLLQHLRTCRPKDVAQHAESALVAMDAEDASIMFAHVLSSRLGAVSTAGASRVRRLLKALSSRMPQNSGSRAIPQGPGGRK